MTKTRQISHTVGASDSSVSSDVIWQRKPQGWITTEKIRREEEGEPWWEYVLLCAGKMWRDGAGKMFFIAEKGLGQTLSDNTGFGNFKQSAQTLMFAL